MPRSRGMIAGAAALVAIAAGAGWFLWPRAGAVPRIDPDDTVQVVRGQAVYAAQCARCHGVNLEGQPNWRVQLPNGRLPAPPHDASGHTWHHPDADLFGITKQGLAAYAPAGYQSDMPAFGGALGDADIAAVLAFIKSRWPADIRARQARLNQQAGQDQ